jgi:hypothetical protein
MMERILSNLERQLRALELLAQLQKEEFSHLSNRNPGGVAIVEFSLQELLRQLGAERKSLFGLYAAMDPAAKRLSDLLGRFDPASRARAETVHAAIGLAEKRCAVQAGRNYDMALGLYDVVKNSMDSLQRLLIPKKETYGARGRVGAAMPAPGRINGRC